MLDMNSLVNIVGDSDVPIEMMTATQVKANLRKGGLYWMDEESLIRQFYMLNQVGHSYKHGDCGEYAIRWLPAEIASQDTGVFEWHIVRMPVDEKAFRFIMSGGVLSKTLAEVVREMDRRHERNDCVVLEDII